MTKGTGCSYCDERLRVNVGLMEENRHLKQRLAELESGTGGDRGDRLYALLALFDWRNGSVLAEMVQAAREGFERSHPVMAESDAWAEFDSLWHSLSDVERLALAGSS